MHRVLPAFFSGCLNHRRVIKQRDPGDTLIACCLMLKIPLGSHLNSTVGLEVISLAEVTNLLFTGCGAMQMKVSVFEFANWAF